MRITSCSIFSSTRKHGFTQSPRKCERLVFSIDSLLFMHMRPKQMTHTNLVSMHTETESKMNWEGTRDPSHKRRNQAVASNSIVR